MEILGILGFMLGLISLVIGCIALYAILTIMTQMNQKPSSEIKPKKFVVPGKGFFYQAPEKKKPKHWSEAELWQREQDEKD